MDRRAFLKTTGLNIAGITAAAKAAPVSISAKNNGRRQAIIILGESVRYDMLSCNAQTGLHTPHHDRIARRGVRFERAYNVQPVCGPARSALWTGRYPHTNGRWGNSMPLGDLGVHCAFIGKWHLDGVDYFGTGRPAPGWDKDYWYDMRDYLMELSPEDRVRSRKPATGEDPKWMADKCYGHRVTTRALDFLFAGREGWGPSFAQLADAHGCAGLPRVRHLGYVDEALKWALLRGAEFVLYPSLFEGFGLPVAEAMSVGAVVCAGETSGVAELGLRPEFLFDPTDPREFARVLRFTMELSPAARADVSRHNREAARRFSWETFGRTLEDLLVREAL